MILMICKSHTQLLAAICTTTYTGIQSVIARIKTRKTLPCSQHEDHYLDTRTQCNSCHRHRTTAATTVSPRNSCTWEQMWRSSQDEALNKWMQFITKNTNRLPHHLA